MTARKNLDTLRCAFEEDGDFCAEAADHAVHHCYAPDVPHSERLGCHRFVPEQRTKATFPGMPTVEVGGASYAVQGHVAAEIERLRNALTDTVKSLRENAHACREAIKLCSGNGMGLLTEAQVCEGTANHLEKVLNG